MKPSLIFMLSVLPFGLFCQNLAYPISKKEPVVDSIFGEAVVDNYRWLENTTRPECRNWVNEQDAFARKELRKASSKYNSYTAIDYLAYAQFRHPKKEGSYYFVRAYYNNVSSPALFVQNTFRDDPELLVDPNFISKEENILLKDYAASADSKYLAYIFNRNGSDWGEIKVVNIKTAIHLNDHLKNVKFSSIAWRGNGFYYSTFSQHLFEETKGQEVYYHELGTEQSEDKLIFRRTSNPRAYFEVTTTSDEQFLIIKEIDEEKRMVNFFYTDFQSPSPALLPLLTKLTYEEDLEILDSKNGLIVAKAQKGVNNGMVVKINPAKPREWSVLLPEYSSAIMNEVILLENKIVAVYQSDGKQQIDFFDYQGKLLGAIKLPFGFAVDGLDGEPSDKKLLFSYEGYTQPKVVYVLDTESMDIKPLEATVVNFDYTLYETKEMEYTSFDGTKVPMVLVYKKGTDLTAKNPTILKAYGGFGAVEEPHFDPGLVHFLNQGGIFVFANIRGGGDKGKEWQIQGAGANKRNSFNDFISAAEFLIAQNYTSPQKLAITGGSNGGLVVGVAMTQRPDLFRVAVPVVAPFDMLRFENFTVGHMHADEYGSTKDETGFNSLFQYSPLNNVKENTKYPATLIMTSEFDDRVPPFHSYKFAAKLQAMADPSSPVLLRVERGAGHQGANSNLSSALREEGDFYDFILYHLKQGE